MEKPLLWLYGPLSAKVCRVQAMALLLNSTYDTLKKVAVQVTNFKLLI